MWPERRREACENYEIRKAFGGTMPSPALVNAMKWLTRFRRVTGFGRCKGV
jgi:hypothetical protein